MSVSNEDRQPMTASRAAEHLAEFFAERRCGNGAKPSPVDTNEAKLYLDALIAHGWGPRPTVNAKRLDRLVTVTQRDNSLSHLLAYLEQAGIEVTQ